MLLDRAHWPVLAVLIGAAVAPVLGECPPQQRARLAAADAGPSDYFGISGAISADTAVVGAYGDDDERRGFIKFAWSRICPEPRTQPPPTRALVRALTRSWPFAGGFGPAVEAERFATYDGCGVFELVASGWTSGAQTRRNRAATSAGGLRIASGSPA